jgi:tripeptidyl-peptidase-1
MSYGLDEQQTCANANCTNVATYFQRTNVEFQKIGLRGTSIFSASGDSGANGRSDGGCSEPYFNALYPAASPYITAVGATQIDDPVYNHFPYEPSVCSPVHSGWTCVSDGTQSAVSYLYASYTSGGGFSNYSAAPSFQSAAIDGYFKSGVPMPPSSYYHHGGKGIPDVSAFGIDGFEVMSTTIDNQGDGTSMATPTFSGVMSVLNSHQIKLTGKPLGFVSPLLYKMWGESPTTFNDVVLGNNICTENGCAGCLGFHAAKGWDPVTGLGTPNFGNMLNYITKLANKRKQQQNVHLAQQ